MGQLDSFTICHGVQRLFLLSQKFKEIFRIRLGKSKPADLPPRKVRLELKKRAVKVTAWQYYYEQRKFLDRDVFALKQMGFCIDLPTAEWQAAPLLFPKRDSLAKLRMALDL